MQHPTREVLRWCGEKLARRNWAAVGGLPRRLAVARIAGRWTPRRFMFKTRGSLVSSALRNVADGTENAGRRGAGTADAQQLQLRPAINTSAFKWPPFVSGCAGRYAGVARRQPVDCPASLRCVRWYVRAGLQNWSPSQISGWLPGFAEDHSMRVSHETIYRSLFIQSRGVLKAALRASACPAPHAQRARTSTNKGRLRGGRSWGAIDPRRPAS